jgi:hypothetical protein
MSIQMTDQQQQSINLPPPPTDLLRQVGISSPTARSISTASSHSEIRTPDETIYQKLMVYKHYLQHERDFVDGEIQALTNNTPGETPREQASFLRLREELKVRYNNITLKLSRVNALLDVLLV